MLKIIWLKSITTNNGIYEFDDIVAADYNHVEQSLLSIDQRNYSKNIGKKSIFSIIFTFLSWN